MLPKVHIFFLELYKTVMRPKLRLPITHLYILFILLLLSGNSYGQLSGNVFKDFNSNGQREVSNEVGVGGILVTAYTTSGSVTTITGFDGSYSFSVTQLPSGTPVRLEFTNLDGLYAGVKGINSNSTVLFVNAGSNVDASLGILEPNEYCDFDGPSILTTCYVNGDPLGGGSAGEDIAMVTFPYTANGLAGQNGAPAPAYVAKIKEVGSAWGLTYQAINKQFLVSALVRRHSGLGPLGTGGLYLVDNPTNTTTPFLDIQGFPLFINTGTNPHVGLPADKLVPNEDSLTIHAAGKTGIGAIALSQNLRTLYLVNLFDKKLYSFEVGVPMTPPTDASTLKSFSIPDPSGVGDHQPWAVTTYRNKVYVGVVNSAQSTQDTTNLDAYVYELDPQTGLFTEVISFPLTYERGPADQTGNCVNIDTWRAWSDVFPQGCAQFFNDGKIVNFVMNPQPILSNISFDTDGSMLLGFMDRFGLFAGYRNLRPKDDGMLYDSFASGDLLRAQYNPLADSFELERNGISGSLVGVGAGNAEGPGGGEFFGDDVWKFFGQPAHNEITNGGILVLPGLGEIMTSAMDPVDEIYQSGGVRTFSNKDGKMLRGFALYSDEPGTLGKSGGVGELKIDCDAAAVELGNRIWYDKNFDGIQDPDETGIDGVTVKLFDMDNNGVEVSSVETQNGGIYRFNPTNTPTLGFYKNYEIRFEFGQNVISNQQFVNLSPKNNDPSANGDERDSDGELQGNTVVVAINSGFPGQTAHKYDIGLIKCEKPDAGSDVAFCLPENSAKLADAAVGQRWDFVSGPVVAQIDAQTGTISGMTTAGEYLFALTFEPAGLSCSDTVRVTIKPLPNGGQDYTNNESLCIEDGTFKLNAITLNGNWSPATNNPTAATIDSDGNITGLTTIGIYTFIYEVNQCVDTVLVQMKDCNIGQIGDFVWSDTNDDGIQDNNELGVDGVTVELYRLDNQGNTEPTPFRTTSTDNNGAYLFDQLPSASYKVRFASSTLPNDTEFSEKKGVGSPTNNSDVDPLTGFTDTIVIDNNTTNNVRMDIDAAIKASCIKPNAGTDFAFCAPQTTYKLNDASAGQAWRLVSGVDNVNLNATTGQVDGMDVDGIYTFALEQSNIGQACADTVIITRRTKPNAGIDLTGNLAVCATQGTASLSATPVNGNWTTALNNPTLVNVDNNGNVTGMNVVGSYAFIYTLDGCSDTVQVQVIDCNVGQIGDFVWSDTNNDGIQDNNELGVDGVTVELYRLDNQGNTEPTPFRTTSTDSNGAYLFDQLPSASYKVRFASSTLPNNTEFSEKKGVGSPTNNSDVDPLTGFTDTIVIDNNTTNNVRMDIDAAIKASCIKPNAGADFAFCAPQTTYKLSDASTGQAWRFVSGVDNVNLNTTTGQVDGMDVDGTYTFALEQSNIGQACADTVIITRRAKPNAGQDITGNNAICTTQGTTKLNAFPTGGTWSAAAGNPTTTTVNNNGDVTGISIAGNYNFVYTVNGCTDTVLVQATVCTIGRIGDFVWLDTNDNGIQDNNELGVEGVILQLCRVDANGNQIGNSIADATTNSNGGYLFDNLEVGTYKVKIVSSSLPSNTALSEKPNTGTNDEIDSDFDPQTLSSATIIISSNSPVRLDVDAALVDTSICVPAACIPISYRKIK